MISLVAGAGGDAREGRMARRWDGVGMPWPSLHTPSQLGRLTPCPLPAKANPRISRGGGGSGSSREGGTPSSGIRVRCLALSVRLPGARRRAGKSVSIICLATRRSSADDDDDDGDGDGGGDGDARDANEAFPPKRAASLKLSYESNPSILDRWNVPWDGKTVVITTLGVGASFLLTGLALAVLVAQLGYGHRQELDFDDQALSIFINQLVQTVVGISVLNSSLSSYKPLPNDFFNYDWKKPFDLHCGWFLWGGLGLIGGAVAVLSASMLASALNGEPIPREEQDALLQLLPLIGTSNRSTLFLLVVTGILAPYLEETFFRGFLLPSFTKWMSAPIAVLLSASAFAFAHFTPGEIPQLFALGIVLGFSYVKTRNLLTPIMIHAFWNSGVVLLLTYLSLQGYNIRELL